MRLSRSFAVLIRAIAAAMLLFSLGPGAAAQGLAKQNGVRLHEACSAARSLLAGQQLAAERAVDAALCIGFLEGFAWGHGWSAWRKGADMYFCPPEHFSYREAVPAVLDYLEAHPERLPADTHILVFSALSAAYPCTP
jgi:hypothetical protein